MKTKMMIAVSLFEIISLTLIAQTNSIDYLGQTPPGDTAVIFAPGIISLPNRLEGSIVFTPDGNECYFGVYEFINNKNVSKILCTKRLNNTWTKIEEAEFSIGQNAWLIRLSIDGNSLFFVKEGDIWKVDRTAGGWGFAFKSVPELKGIQESETHPVKLWETKKSDRQPETVIYDSLNNVVYCSQFDVEFYKYKEPRGYISKISMNGEILNLKWIDSLYAPAGMCLYKNKLYILERRSMAVASVADGKIIKRYPFPDEAGFPNDIVVDEKGNLYITNSDQKAEAVDIFLFKNNHFIKWLASDESSGTNGILYTGNEIVFGNSGKGLLQAVDIKTKNIRTIASIGAGIVDGIKMNSNGNYLVSTSLTGNLYEVTISGKVTRLINAGKGFNIANINYIKSNKLLLIPTFLNGTVQAYRMENW